MITYLVISMVGILLATYFDLKTRIIPLWLTSLLTGIGIIIFFISPITWFSIVSLIAGLILGVGLWLRKAWGGGDMKLVIAISFLNANNPFLLALFFVLTFVWLVIITRFWKADYIPMGTCFSLSYITSFLLLMIILLPL